MRSRRVRAPRKGELSLRNRLTRRSKLTWRSQRTSPHFRVHLSRWATPHTTSHIWDPLFPTSFSALGNPFHSPLLHNNALASAVQIEPFGKLAKPHDSRAVGEYEWNSGRQDWRWTWRLREAPKEPAIPSLMS